MMFAKEELQAAKDRSYSYNCIPESGLNTTGSKPQT